jgi:multicomponent Na+:H+ antiporter subunit A
VIVDTTARLVYPSALVLSLYLLVAGHNQPGGGFVGGLVAGAAIALVYVAGGIEKVRALAPVLPWHVLGAGLLLAGGTALVPLVTGAALLEHGTVELDLAALGQVKLTSTLAFDAGVYLVVVGLVLMVLEAFGEEVAPPTASARGDRERPGVGR